MVCLATLISVLSLLLGWDILAATMILAASASLGRMVEFAAPVDKIAGAEAVAADRTLEGGLLAVAVERMVRAEIPAR